MSKIEKVVSLIDDSEVVQVARELIQTPSETRYEGRGMLSFYERWFGDLKIPMRLYPVDSERANFFADFESSGGTKGYLFNGHQDTKPVKGMTIDPFGALVKDGKIYGRGACDMKSSIAGMLCAIKAMVRAGVKPEKGVTFFSDIEEEYGSNIGFLNILEKGLLDSFEGLISGEPSEMKIYIGDLGACATAFETEGVPVHTSVADFNLNPICNLSRFITEYIKLPYLKMENKYLGKCAVNFDRIECESMADTVPSKAIVCLDTRFVPEATPELVMNQIDGLIARLDGEYGIKIKKTDPPSTWRPKSSIRKASFIPETHPFVKWVGNSYKKALGIEPEYAGCPGATLIYFTLEKGIPSVIIGCGSIEQAHTEDEWVDITHLPKAAKIYAALMAEM